MLEDNIKSLLHLGLNAITINGIILIRANRVHNAAYHVDAKAIRQVLVVKQRFQHSLPRPDGIARNSVVAHIQCDQRKCGAVDRIGAAVIVEGSRQIIHFVTLFVSIRHSVMILRKIRTVEATCCQHHDRAAKFRHGNTGSRIKR